MDPGAQPLERLKRRKLVRWSLAYLGGAAALFGTLEAVGDVFGWPGGVLRAVFFLLLGGLLATAALGERAAAEQALARARRSIVRPDAPSPTEAYNLGIALVRMGRHDEALDLIAAARPRGNLVLVRSPEPGVRPAAERAAIPRGRFGRRA